MWRTLEYAAIHSAIFDEEQDSEDSFSTKTIRKDRKTDDSAIVEEHSDNALAPYTNEAWDDT